MIVARILKRILVSLIAIAIVWAYFQFFYLPNDRKIMAIRERVEKLRGDVSACLAIKSDLARFVRDESSIKEELGLLQQKIPQSNLMLLIIQSLSKYSTSSGTDIHTMQPGESKEESFRVGAETSGTLVYEETPITIEMSGAFGSILKYLGCIKELDQLVVIRKVEMTAQPSSLSSRIELGTYMVKKL